MLWLENKKCILRCSVCGMNVHKRCQKNVANNCGINTKDMANVLNELGISGDKLNASKRKKVDAVRGSFFFYHVDVLSISRL